MSKRIHPSIIAQRSYSMLTGKPKAQKRLVDVPHGQRPVTFGNRLGAAYYTLDDIKRMDEARAVSARTFLLSSIDSLK
jgi:hypothetical protein